jgi:formylglycine-generating enzyme required for sulfatase activity
LRFVPNSALSMVEYNSRHKGRPMEALIAALLISLVSSATARGEDIQRVAVVVGVPAYRPGQGLKQLPYAENDALLLADVLESRDYEVTLLTPLTAQVRERDELHPRANSIRAQLDAALNDPDLGPDDVLLVALAGRAVTLESIEEAQVDGDAIERLSPRLFFCAADSILQEDGNDTTLPLASEVEEQHHLIPLDEIYERMARCRAGTKLLLIDVCRRDPAREPSPNDSAPLPELSAPPAGVIALFGCSTGEYSWEDRDLAQGVFFHHVARVLRREVEADAVTPDSLNTLVSAEVQEYVATHRELLGEHKQTPLMIGTGNGKVSLVEVFPPPLIAPFNADEARRGQEAWADHFATDVVVENSIGMRLAMIPPGEFTMGSAQPDYEVERQHRVRLTQPYFLGVHEVTVGQFRQFIDETGHSMVSDRPGTGAGGWDPEKESLEFYVRKYAWNNVGWTPYDDNHPVVNVNWNDAVAFCNWLSREENLDEYYEVIDNTVTIRGGSGYRLPTEAEWEYACRAGTTTNWQHGDEVEGITNFGNVMDLTAKETFHLNQNLDFANAHDGYAFTAPVGQFTANAFGMHDMHGNVREWCWDGYEREAYQTRIGITDNPVTGHQETRFGWWGVDSRTNAQRVLRGGSWWRDAELTGAPDRRFDWRSRRQLDYGFRVARTP